MTEKTSTLQSSSEAKAPEKSKKEKDFKKEYSLKSMIDLVKYPVITEKTSIALANNRQYTFDVDKRLTKTQIKKLFESLFEVDVIGVNTHIPPRKTVRVGLARGFRPSYKRAIITVKENQSINFNLKLSPTSKEGAKSATEEQS
jgi:large subunit ribosomal protein L23